MGATPTNAESHCKKFLDLLKSQAFREEDIAVVFGLVGKYEDEQIVKKTVESDKKGALNG